MCVFTLQPKSNEVYYDGKIVLHCELLELCVCVLLVRFYFFHANYEYDFFAFPLIHIYLLFFQCIHYSVGVVLFIQMAFFL